MKISYYNQKRQSGKTTQLLNYFYYKPDRTLFIVHNSNMKDWLKQRISQEYHKNIITVDGLKKIHGYSYDRILIDEYDFIKNKSELTHYLYPLFGENTEVIIKTTPAKQYKKQNYIIAKLLYLFSNEDRNTYLYMLDNDDSKEVDELLGSLITHKNTVLYDTSINTSPNYYNVTELTGEMFK